MSETLRIKGRDRANGQIIVPGQEAAMPWDLAEWFDPGALQGWIEEESATLDWNNPELADYLRVNPSYHPKVLLTLLTYAYATAKFDSEEILLGCHQHPILRAICGDQPPGSAKAITRFRRENRGLIKWCLVQLFKRAIKARLGELFLPAGVKRRLIEAAVARLDMARQLDHGNEGL